MATIARPTKRYYVEVTATTYMEGLTIHGKCRFGPVDTLPIANRLRKKLMTINGMTSASVITEATY